MKNFFLSLKTSVWTLLILVCLFFAGSFLMPAYREVFAPMNDDLLLNWATDTAIRSPWLTWWFFGALAGLLILAVNTIVCSIEAVKGRWSKPDFLARVLPQVIHAGFLFILLAHLLSAVSGYKLSGILPEGGSGGLPENRALHLEEIHVETDRAGYVSDWTASIAVYENNAFVQRGMLAPNSPVFYKGVGIYLKTLNFERGPAALLMVVKDPGAVWALVGGLLFTLGSVVLLAVKWRKA